MSTVTNAMVELVQQQLNKHLGTSLIADGFTGPLTRAAILTIPTIAPSWTQARKFVGAIQYFATMQGIDSGPIDGYWGPQTSEAYEQLRHLLSTGSSDNWRDYNVQPSVPSWPNGNTQSMVDYFGPVGTNQTTVTVPYTLKIAWDLDRTLDQFTCHALVADSIQLAMEEILEVYGLDGIQELGLDLWGGCFNVRKMRGGSNWSMHSWGAAIDWDPARNRLKWGRTKAELAKPVYEQFWNAWEHQGWASQGRTRGFDFMHVQAARL